MASTMKLQQSTPTTLRRRVNIDPSKKKD
jgi:hypothetical protein